MNMPTHIIANPAHVETVTDSAALALVAGVMMRQPD
jgi:hypothetical protein